MKITAGFPPARKVSKRCIEGKGDTVALRFQCALECITCNQNSLKAVPEHVKSPSLVAEIDRVRQPGLNSWEAQRSLAMAVSPRLPNGSCVVLSRFNCPADEVVGWSSRFSRHILALS